MERSLCSALITTLLGFTTLGGLASFSSAPGPVKNPPPGDTTWRLLEPITYENISIFPVVSAFPQDTTGFLTLDEGLSNGEVIVTEQGATGLVRTRDTRPGRPSQSSNGASVNQLVLINRGKRPLLLLAGELVSGGKQDRIIGKDRLVPVGADPLPLEVFCVEHGRWSNGSQFAAATTIVHPSVREQAAVGQDQNDVWNAVLAGSTFENLSPGSPAPHVSARDIAGTVASAAPTQSYARIYQDGKVGASVDQFVEQLQKRFRKATASLPCLHSCESVVGVIVAYGGEVAWSDIFASRDLFDRYWSKLLRSYAVEALARPTLREVASADDAREFLRRPNGREVLENEPGVYRWREITEGKLSLIELEALQPKPITLHRLLLHRTT